MTIQINQQQKRKKTHWQIVKIDIQQYSKMRWSLLWKETSVFLMPVILYILSLKLMFNRAGQNRISCPMPRKMLWQVYHIHFIWKGDQSEIEFFGCFMPVFNCFQLNTVWPHTCAAWCKWESKSPKQIVFSKLLETWYLNFASRPFVLFNFCLNWAIYSLNVRCSFIIIPRYLIWFWMRLKYNYSSFANV